MRRPVRVPKIDWSSTGNELVNARKGYGLAPPAKDPNPGIADMVAMQGSMDGAQLCALGYHAWMPWLKVDQQWVTWCSRCRHREIYHTSLWGNVGAPL